MKFLINSRSGWLFVILQGTWGLFYQCYSCNSLAWVPPQRSAAGAISARCRAGSEFMLSSTNILWISFVLGILSSNYIRLWSNSPVSMDIQSILAILDILKCYGLLNRSVESMVSGLNVWWLLPYRHSLLSLGAPATRSSIDHWFSNLGD